MALVEIPVSARTPTDLFATLALSPTLASGLPSAVPAICFSPPTPPTADSVARLQLQRLKEHLYGHLPSNSNGKNLVENGLPTPEDSEDDPPLPSASFLPPQTVGAPKHRPLASNEARQLSLLMIQHLFPARGHPKLMMRESIALAERLHEAGIRWDTKRRVMGMHLKGIWEEGQRLSTVGRAVGGHGPMDLYVQGSFLSIMEEPHPLDPMPIPLELHPASFAALPKLTLQAGLANSLPGAPSQFDHFFPEDQHHGNEVIVRDYAHQHGARVHAAQGEAGDTHRGLEMDVDAPREEVKHDNHSMRTRWRARKARGLRIHTDGHSRLTTRTKAFQLYPASATLSAKLAYGSRTRRFWSIRKSRNLAGSRSAKYTKRKFSVKWARLLKGDPKSAMSARLTFGAWEVR